MKMTYLIPKCKKKKKEERKKKPSVEIKNVSVGLKMGAFDL